MWIAEEKAHPKIHPGDNIDTAIVVEDIKPVKEAKSSPSKAQTTHSGEHLKVVTKALTSGGRFHYAVLYSSHGSSVGCTTLCSIHSSNVAYIVY
jgi:hypothetical protein